MPMTPLERWRNAEARPGARLRLIASQIRNKRERARVLAQADRLDALVTRATAKCMSQSTEKCITIRDGARDRTDTSTDNGTGKPTTRHYPRNSGRPKEVIASTRSHVWSRHLSLS